MSDPRCLTRRCLKRPFAWGSSSVTYLIVLFAVLFTRHSVVAHGIMPLPTNISIGNLNPDTFTISGISSGACMALQFQYAWSTIVRGAGLVAAAPYLCAGGTLAGAEACLNTPLVEDASVFLASAMTSATLSLIDPLENLRNQTIFLFSGTADTVVPQPNMDNVALMFELAGASPRMTKMFNYSAEHAWVTSKYGNDCGHLGTPYVNNCEVDFGRMFLEQAFDDFGLEWNTTEGAVSLNHLYSFNQQNFGADPATNSMAIEGYIYIPAACESGDIVCHLHVNLHGCQQDFISVGTEYMLQTQLNEWAESNNVVILYPQATANDALLNPLGCFDWWGYAGETYATKTGPQITIIRYLIEHFGGF